MVEGRFKQEPQSSLELDRGLEHEGDRDSPLGVEYGGRLSANWGILKTVTGIPSNVTGNGKGVGTCNMIGGGIYTPREGKWAGLPLCMHCMHPLGGDQDCKSHMFYIKCHCPIYINYMDVIMSPALKLPVFLGKKLCSKHGHRWHRQHADQIYHSRRRQY